MNTYIGAVDTPVVASTQRYGAAFLVRGWACDTSAQGWAGFDQVQIYDGQMGSGGRLLTGGGIGQSRPDVAATSGLANCAPSGFTALVPSTAFPSSRSVSMSVYLHTPAKGWWLLSDPITISAQTSPIPAPQGSDISYPSCSGTYPTNQTFGIVGVNGGKTYSPNPCLPAESTWALRSSSTGQPHLSFYLNTANPGPDASSHWPAAGTTAPQACDGSWSAGCSYDYGFNAAKDSENDALNAVGSGATSAPWWLDVETANSWSADPATNTSDLRGTVAALQAAGVTTVGVYTAPHDWATIAGAPAAGGGPFSTLPNWIAGAGSLQDAPNYCTMSVTGGSVKYVQYVSADGVDSDYACS